MNYIPNTFLFFILRPGSSHKIIKLSRVCSNLCEILLPQHSRVFSLQACAWLLIFCINVDNDPLFCVVLYSFSLHFSCLASHPISQVRKLRPQERKSWPRSSPKTWAGSQVWGFLGAWAHVLPRDPTSSPLPCSFPSEAQSLGQAGNVLGRPLPVSRPCVSVLLFARRGVNEVMGPLRHAIRLGLTAPLCARRPGCSV